MLPLVSSSSSLGSQLVSHLEVAFYELSWLHRLLARAHLSARLPLVTRLVLPLVSRSLSSRLYDASMS